MLKKNQITEGCMASEIHKAFLRFPIHRNTNDLFGTPQTLGRSDVDRHTQVPS